MCELCLPAMTRRRVLALAGAATAAAMLGTPDRSAAAQALRTGYGVDIQPREAWAGDTHPYLGDAASEDVRFLLVHHTAGPSSGDPIELMRDVYRFHTSADKGWPDVAYNFFIEPGGAVYEARSGSLARAVEASATGGNQGFAQLVCLLGDFTAQNPSPAALTTLNATLAWLADRYGLETSAGATTDFVSRGSNRWPAGTSVTANVISGHRDMSRTACPGDTFYPYLMANVQSQVDQLRTNPLLTPAAAPEPTQAPFPDQPATTTQAPAMTSPAATQPAATQPAATQPVSTQPVSTQPVSTQPVSTQQASTQQAGAVVAAPELQSNEFADGQTPTVEPIEGSGSTTTSAWNPSNTMAWGIGAGAAAVVAAAAVFVGVRGRDEDSKGDASADGAGGHSASRID